MQSQQQKIKIIITDDHQLYRAGVIKALVGKTNVQFIAEAEQGADLLEKLEYLEPDIIILGIQMPVMDGLTALPILKQKYPGIKIIMLSMIDDATIICKAITLGANAYLLKTSESKEIYEAIMVCCNQWFYINETLRTALQQTALKYTKNGRIGFSDREEQILKLLVAGNSVQQIATAMELSSRTIEAIINRLKEKVNVTTLDELFKYSKNM
jgi:DNA-binding NarL/FixJ family response regulator